MSSIVIIILILLTSVIIYRVCLRKNKCTSSECMEDPRANDISRAKMNLDPKWNKGCVRDTKTGQFRRK